MFSRAPVRVGARISESGDQSGNDSPLGAGPVHAGAAHKKAFIPGSVRMKAANLACPDATRAGPGLILRFAGEVGPIAGRVFPRLRNRS